MARDFTWVTGFPHKAPTRGSANGIMAPAFLSYASPTWQHALSTERSVHTGHDLVTCFPQQFERVTVIEVRGRMITIQASYVTMAIVPRGTVSRKVLACSRGSDSARR